LKRRRNVSAAGAPPRTPLGSLQCFQTPSWVSRRGDRGKVRVVWGGVIREGREKGSDGKDPSPQQKIEKSTTGYS